MTDDTTDYEPFSPDEISNWFWDVIARANENSERLSEILHEFPSDDLRRFEDEFQHAAAQLQDEPFTDYVDEDISEDGLKDIAAFVVSQGKAFFISVWEDPSQMPASVDENDPRLFSGVAMQVHWDKFEDEIVFDANHEFRPYK